MIKPLFLPHRTIPPELRIDLSCRRRLDGLHNLCQREELLSLIVNEGRENQMHMVRHNDGHIELVALSVIMAAAREHNVARRRWQDPAELRNQCNEVRGEIFLQMRQISPVEPHGRIVPQQNNQNAEYPTKNRNMFPHRESTTPM